MKVSSSVVSLNVEDAAASSHLLQQHFGFREEMAAGGFASLTGDDVGMNVVFLRWGLPTLPADQRDVHAVGLILAFVVDDLEGELARLRAEGVTITMPLTAEEWGERAFQVRDPTESSSSWATWWKKEARARGATASRRHRPRADAWPPWPGRPWPACSGGSPRQPVATLSITRR